MSEKISTAFSHRQKLIVQSMSEKLFLENTAKTYSTNLLFESFLMRIYFSGS